MDKARSRLERRKVVKTVHNKCRQTLGAMGIVTVTPFIYRTFSGYLFTSSHTLTDSFSCFLHTTAALGLLKECWAVCMSLCHIYIPHRLLRLPELEMAPRGMLPWIAASCNRLLLLAPPLNGAEVVCVEVFDVCGLCCGKSAE